MATRKPRARTLHEGPQIRVRCSPADHQKYFALALQYRVAGASSTSDKRLLAPFVRAVLEALCVAPPQMVRKFLVMSYAADASRTVRASRPPRRRAA